MSPRRKGCRECLEPIGHKPVCPIGKERAAAAIERGPSWGSFNNLDNALPKPRRDTEVIRHLDAAIMESSGIPCRTPGCDPALMEDDIDSPDVCDTCRAHWLMETARTAAERHSRLADDMGFADEVKQ